MECNLTIVIPVYNAEKYINECLDSIVTQNRNDIEVILVDDGSSDKSLVICKEYAQKYGYMTVLTQKNTGSSSVGRNIGILKAKGKYIWFVDSDDFIASNSLELIISKLKGYDILYFDYYYKQKNSIYKKFSYIESYDSIFKKTATTSVWCCVYRTTFLKENNLSFPAGYYHQDDFFSLRALVLANSINHISYALYFYRADNPTSVMNKQSRKKIEDLYDITKMNMVFFQSKLSFNDFDSFIKEICVPKLLDYIIFCLLSYPGHSSVYRNKVILALNNTDIDWKCSSYFNDDNIMLRLFRKGLCNDILFKIYKTYPVRKMLTMIMEA